MEVVEGTVEIRDVPGFVEQLASIGDEYDCAIQAFDPAYVAGHAHLRVAVERALRAQARDEMISDSLSIEVLCYAAGRRQINQALEMGVSEGEQAVVIVIVGEKEASAKTAVREFVTGHPVVGDERDEEVITAFFDITEAERSVSSASLEELVIERVSLLVVEK